MDLFFDLIYVAILIELGNRLSANLSLQGTVEFALIFIPIWWSWLVLGIIGAGLNAGTLLLLVAAVLVIQVGLDIYWHVNRPMLAAGDNMNSI